MTGAIKFTLDGGEVEAAPGETIWQVAERQGTRIPHLCWLPEPGYRADGNCRACMVEIEGERVLAASCLRKPTAGMKVVTASERARTARRMVMELLLADQPARQVAHHPDSRLWQWAERMGLQSSRFPERRPQVADLSHPAMAVNLDACIHCNLCVRACREVQVNDVIGMAYRNIGSKIVFDMDDPMGASTCVACGECVQACPTGALMPATVVDERGIGHPEVDRRVASVCPYCGVGCQITYHVKDDRIRYVTGRQGPANENRLCVKGRFGFDYIAHRDRLTRPLIRQDGVPKVVDDAIDPANPLTHFREASWDEALDLAAKGLRAIRDGHGPKALAGFGSAKGSNEEAYLVQKLIRTGFGSNNVDHCTRLCHASSVAALLENIGSGAVTAPFTAVKDAEVIIVIGANPTENHPVAATYFKQAAKAGKTLIVMDPRGQALKRHATHMLQFKPGTDVALLNALMHVIVEEGLYDRQYIQAHTAGFERLKEHLRQFPPEQMAAVCGIDAEMLRTVARKFATAQRAIVFWGMGISQHVHGTDNARCLISLVLMCGQVGRRGTGLHPLRGQNNVQGASDAGLIPMMFPDYGRVSQDQVRQRFEESVGDKARPRAGPHGGRDRARDPRRRDQGHVRDGREPGDVRSGRPARARGARQARASGGAGPVPDRDRDVRRRRAAGLGLAREGGHGHQHQPPGADGPRRFAAAGRGPPGLVDRAGDRAPDRARLALSASARRLRRDAPGDALARQHHLGPADGRELGHLSLRRAGPAGPRHRVRRPFSDRRRPRHVHARGRAAARPSCRTTTTRWC